jgi:starch-binding outer membrane protein, SusD/RagB family
MQKLNYIYLLLVLNFVSCEQYLDIEPVGQVIPKSVEEYRSFMTSAYAISKSYKVLTTYRGDELSLQSTAVGIDQYKDIFIWNDLNPDISTTAFPYASLYNTIFYSNHVINNATTMEGDVVAKNQLLSEAYALRAMTYFELVNLYAKPYNKATASTDAAVPITTEYDSEKKYPVKTVQEVYNLILSDIEQAEALENMKQQAVGYNYRFSTIAVKALKSRVYLYQHEWQKAIDEANEALAIKSSIQDLNSNLTIMPSEYNSVESILALETVASFDMVNNARIATDLISAYDKTTDLRFALYFSPNTDGSYRSNKSADSKFKSSYRIAELYLTTAECLVQLDELEAAKQKLIDFTKNRYTAVGWAAYTTKVNALNTADLLTEILEERRREFAIEGYRWNDLRRTTQQALTKNFNGKNYTLTKNDSRYVIPFPKDATINNPNL